MNGNDYVASKENEIFSFRPYAPLRFIVYFLALGCLFLIFSLQFFPSVLGKVLCILTIIVSALIVKEFSAWLPMLVTVSSQSICLRNTDTGEFFEQMWSKFCYAYCLRGSKGHLYVLFSVESLDLDEQMTTWRMLHTPIRGHPPLSSNGNICVRVDGHWRKIEQYLGDNITIILGTNCARVG